MQKTILAEEYARTQNVAEEVKDIRNVLRIQHDGVKNDDKVLAEVDVNLGEVKRNVDEGGNQLTKVSC